jgi:hypothetical protein
MIPRKILPSSAPLGTAPPPSTEEGGGAKVAATKVGKVGGDCGYDERLGDFCTTVFLSPEAKEHEGEPKCAFARTSRSRLRLCNVLSRSERRHWGVGKPGGLTNTYCLTGRGGLLFY